MEWNGPEHSNPLRSKDRSYYCVARWCSNHNGNSSAMFRLPKGSRGKEWLRNAEREDLLALSEEKLHRKYMCSKHFMPECFFKPNLLYRNAVPTLFTVPTYCKAPEIPVIKNLPPLAPKTLLMKDSESTVNLNRNLTFVPSKISQVAATLATSNDNNEKKCSTIEVKTSLADNKHSEVQPKRPLPTPSKTDSSSDVVENCETDQMVFLEEFPILKQEPVLSCSTCGEVFLVESGLALHRLRYHSDIGCKDI